MNHRTFGSVLLAVAAAGILGSAVPLLAQGRKNEKSIVGYVDMGQITDQIKQTPTWLQMVKSFDDTRQRLESELRTLNESRYLTDAEREEIKNLNAKPKPSDSETKRIAELKAKSTQIDTEFQTLSRLEKLDPKQKQRLADIGTLREKAVASLQDEGEKRNQQLQQMQVDMIQKMDERIRSVTQQVAEQRSLSIVVDKSMLIYGGDDLTADVLKKIR